MFTVQSYAAEVILLHWDHPIYLLQWNHASVLLSVVSTEDYLNKIKSIKNLPCIIIRHSCSMPIWARHYAIDKTRTNTMSPNQPKTTVCAKEHLPHNDECALGWERQRPGAS
ncbi:hypothetical protein Pelo_12980 [Pelomyxa schiedti]|nr:hypothetical protein Pelo_12980 [Pelomyxa schiedti]